MKVLDKLWFTNRNGRIGIVVIEEAVTGDRKAYIGIVEGKSEFTDTEAILLGETGFIQIQPSGLSDC